MDLPTTHAVFISYASQDAAAAIRICEALRAAGIVVWLDQSELVGGDAWDRKIRGQIASCTLFLPVISAATQARHEGYFRLEWKLAAQRTHMISERTAFLLPIVIDATRDAEADVPDEFRAVQWTRLPGGEMSATFCERVKKLFGIPEVETGRPGPAQRDEGVASPSTPKVGRRVPAAAGGSAIFICALVLGFLWWRNAQPTPNAGAGPRPPTSENSLPAAPLAATDQKSVAVLAFANMSAEKDTEYFSDGISEELLNVLAKIPGLKVSARTSAFFFKGKDTPIPEIAKQLGVAYVVEGSVRKSGDKVRITAQLIKAADGFHVWSDSFTRDLKDIFAVQDEIAGLIAQQMQLKLGGASANAAIDPAIYELLLQARALALRESNAGWQQAIALYRRAVEQEPRLAMAWAEMARTYVQLGRFGGMPMPDAMREARTSAQRSLELEPDQITGLAALGWVQRTADWDWRGARRSFQRAAELAPGNAAIMGDRAVFTFNIGRVDEAKSLAREAVARDPLSARVQATLGFILNLNRDWEQALAPLAKAVELAPAIEEVRSHQARALSQLGRLGEAAAAAEQEPNEAYRLVARSYILGPRGDQSLAELIAKYGDTMPGYVAHLYAIRDDVEPSFAWFERALTRRDAAVVWMKSANRSNVLQADPRWPALLQKIGLSDEQLK